MSIDPRHERNAAQHIDEQLAGAPPRYDRSADSCARPPAQRTDVSYDQDLVIAGAERAASFLSSCNAGDTVSVRETGTWLLAYPDGAHGLVPALAGYTVSALWRLYGDDAGRRMQALICLAHTSEFRNSLERMTGLTGQLSDQHEGFRCAPALMQHMLRADQRHTVLLFQQLTENPRIAFGAAAGLAYLLSACAQTTLGADEADQYIEDLCRRAAHVLPRLPLREELFGRDTRRI